ncbi:MULTISPECIES: DUF4916 domain-containing protein [Brevibacterium]|uniref:DUF4916 domain-containing protein n=1 Tax=Brevibacterium ravenspurgense TaxID=479117 RepID=A0A150H8S8_9MICO|nr:MULTISPECIES: DUF4916 domain-containing protein [Brevibacterium]KXZ58516.1 hypothetical protein Bravens_01565 [Brevibacterium ravenspurgense]MCG7300330.1 NUDIX hydrolase family protein [Brevibacterium ravenspurgense]OFT92696.1 ADP-ribose pyrophosphatase [Brevibacterium sp. HMSC24B04]OFT97233.1 ADP-ribose pyrophosphatase [Brevibacterium sp. HMSC22B09]HJH12929.1 NUDIX hydrolase family protein [Brevibacterium ravenspurgense]
MTRTALDYDDNWFSADELAYLRRRLPITYVHAVPLLLGQAGEVERIGLLMRQSEGRLGRELVGGRVKYHEPLRAALQRHLESDLGPLALPRLPESLTPFHVAEYFPTEGESRYYDPRQHAIALCYTVPVTGECQPSQDALSVDWYTPAQALADTVAEDMAHGQHAIVKLALAHCGVLP